MNGERLEQTLTEALRANASALLRYFESRLELDDAPDALSEVMVTAWRRVRDLPPDEVEQRMWLFGIARHVLANARRAALRKWRLADRLRAVPVVQDDSEQREREAEVTQALSELEDDDAELVRLVHWDGFTLAESARLLGIPSSTARGRYQRIRAELRRALTHEEQLR